MRKLVIVVIAIFAVFTFIREYPSEERSPRTVQGSAVDSSLPN
jgi:hypothetical protein